MSQSYSPRIADALPRRRVRKEWRFFVLLENRQLRWDRIVTMIIAASLWIGIIAAIRALWY